MRGGPAKRHRLARLTAVGWIVLGLAVATAIGFAIGSEIVWFAAAILLLFVLLGALAIPRNVEDLEVPPGMTNVPGDITRHERERED